jgi:hypothetical protein
MRPLPPGARERGGCYPADRHSAGQALAAGVMRRNLDGSEAGKLTRKEGSTAS